MKRTGLLLGLFFTILSCSTSEQKKFQRDTYFVESNGAYLPVMIEGPNTDKVIFFVHGGPGSTSILCYYQPFFQELLKRYRVVFWDQRGSGGARGYPSESSITINQEVEDAWEVLSSVKSRYPNSKIYLFGMSFGGTVAGAFASVYSDQIEASVFMVPVFNFKEVRREVSKHSLSFIDPLLQESLSVPDRRFWEKAKIFYENRPILNGCDFEQHQKYAEAIDVVNGLNAYKKVLRDNISNFLNDVVLRIFSLKKQVLKFVMVLEKNGQAELNLTTDPKFNLKNVTHPVLVIVGEKDYMVTSENAKRGYQVLNGGTPAPGSKLLVSKASHSVHLDDESNVFSEFTQFIDAH